MLIKRVLDIVLSALILIFTSPLLLVAALSIWLESGTPILFHQKRVVLGFRSFSILKFRTMSPRGTGPSVTIQGDTRITKVGRMLRLTKVDELPQFWNVVRGDMSIVGPRPEVAEYVELFRARYQEILAVRPGITDLASIQFRNEEMLLAKSPAPLVEYRERILPAKLDLAEKYLREWSITRDIVIIIRTMIVTLWPDGFVSNDS
jgi:lipopolysaccharide/colanic/teichoic acid biosynthesis glycosyltransferase